MIFSCCNPLVGRSQQTPARLGDHAHYKVLVYDMDPPASGDYDDDSSPTIVFTRFGPEADHVAQRQEQEKIYRSMGTEYRARVTETSPTLPADATPGYLIVKKVPRAERNVFCLAKPFSPRNMYTTRHSKICRVKRHGRIR